MYLLSVRRWDSRNLGPTLRSNNELYLGVTTSELVVPGERLSEVGGLRADEEVVLVEDLVLGELPVGVGVGLVDEVLRLRVRRVEVLGDDPRTNLKSFNDFLNQQFDVKTLA